MSISAQFLCRLTFVITFLCLLYRLQALVARPPHRLIFPSPARGSSGNLDHALAALANSGNPLELARDYLRVCVLYNVKVCTDSYILGPLGSATSKWRIESAAGCIEPEVRGTQTLDR